MQLLMIVFACLVGPQFKTALLLHLWGKYMFVWHSMYWSIAWENKCAHICTRCFGNCYNKHKLKTNGKCNGMYNGKLIVCPIHRMNSCMKTVHKKTVLE